ncbi:MAG: VOC family protein [Pseudomonadales bacterium]|jgi:methylmalonyl-CoA/ethylmalonyl-CoA epimerase|nr:VOC family protein [Pseudomonadales bacterium]MDP7358551.1 VOC family protein [Pseudomonadales bacterium]MDP7596012.1 VOC family protein [Pseudomonadales bacterium]HJN53062.1 VOC family protein [Pseudomonadales bacterium]|tara:strand:+ start:104 stop:556 length:453 start_codon:yes stop_codon:yes gene_type:complete
MKTDWKLHHVGVVVRDLDKSVEYYKTLGLVEKVSALMTAEGKKAKLLGKFLRVGSLNLELWQPIRGATVQQEFLDSCGEGINHIAYTVDDYEKEYVELVEKQGIRLVFGSRPPFSGRAQAGYFDTRKEGHNIILELMVLSPDYEVPQWLP